jgi:hypothetical protein
MATANLLSLAMLLVISGLIAWHFAGDRRYLDPPDEQGRQRRYRIAWEVRGMIVGVTGPYGMGIYLGYISRDYAAPLLLFAVAGFLVAEMIAPSGIWHRR